MVLPGLIEESHFTALGTPGSQLQRTSRAPGQTCLQFAKKGQDQGKTRNYDVELGINPCWWIRRSLQYWHFGTKIAKIVSPN
jgi:hypothetical protein